LGDWKPESAPELQPVPPPSGSSTTDKVDLYRVDVLVKHPVTPGKPAAAANLEYTVEYKYVIAPAPGSKEQQVVWHSRVQNRIQTLNPKP
jgi:hypothetical protein